MATRTKFVRRSSGLFSKSSPPVSFPKTRPLSSIVYDQSLYTPGSSSPVSLPKKEPYSIIVCNQQRNTPSRSSFLRYQWKRNISHSARKNITGQEAPSAGAYISSGVLSGQKNLVDVKKVLVIGSGGLSIGQAGEFDYSGKTCFRFGFLRPKEFYSMPSNSSPSL
jgi:hypothetical protein